MMNSTFVTCQACKLGITGVSMLSVEERSYHETCLTCTYCSKGLNQSCYVKDNLFYCKTHYFQLFSPRQCEGCHEGLAPWDAVHKLGNQKIYHESCLSCDCCSQKLPVGKKICIDSLHNTVMCFDHYNDEEGDQDSSSGSSSPCEFTDLDSIAKRDDTQNNDFSVEFPAADQKSPKEQKTESGEPMTVELMESSGASGSKRRRTILRPDQVDVLQQMFYVTQNPGKAFREKLSLQLGLSPKTIQVWFQNRRSKERKESVKRQLGHFLEERQRTTTNLSREGRDEIMVAQEPEVFHSIVF